MKILITTEPDDIHAMLVKMALNNLGHSCVLWFTADMPTRQTNTLYLSNDDYWWLSENDAEQSFEITSDTFDVVWWRRPRKPYINEAVHRHDQSFVKKENSLFHSSFPWVIANDAWWINPYESIAQASSKTYQLKLAATCGLTISPTLISNSPSKIKEFISDHNNSDMVYKPFSAHHWYENDKLKFSYTQKVSLEQLPPDDILRFTPGIYQQRIEKKYELRVTCFGDHLVAVKIGSQCHPKGLIDWRIIPPQELPLEPYQLPAELENKIRLYMKSLGIVFGCFDFIVTPDDEIYFLEVNQQGQFLWVEDRLPEVKMLDTFVNFLLNKSANFQHKPTENAMNLRAYQDKGTVLVRENMQKHVYLNGIKKAS